MNRQKRPRKKKDASIRDFVGLDSIVRTRIHAKVYKFTVNVPAEARNAVMGLQTTKSRKILLDHERHPACSNLLEPHPTPSYTSYIVANTSFRSLRLSVTSHRHEQGAAAFSIARPSNRTPRSHCPRLQAHRSRTPDAISLCRRNLVRTL